MTRVIHTIAGIQLVHGGTSRSVPALCEALARRDVEVHLVTGRPADKTTGSNPPGAAVSTHWVDESPVTGRWLTGGAFRQELRALTHGVPGPTVIHDHGLWLSSNHAVASFATANHLPRVVSTRGMLSSWAMKNGRLKKKICWWIRQHADLLSASAFHATSEAEASDIRSHGFTQPIAIIPNGITLPPRVEPRTNADRRRMLFLSRLHPVKGISNLIHAFQRTCAANDWELVLAGPGESGYRDAMQKLVEQLGLASRVSIIGPVSDDDKWNLYATADLFVLPSFSENFGISVAEALAAGIPVITTTATPWSGLKNRNAGWWIDPTIDSVAEAMLEAIHLQPEKLLEMGARGSEWVRSEFKWDSIAERMIELYQWLCQSRSRPDSVV